MNYRLEYRGIDLSPGRGFTFDIGATALEVIQALPGEVVYRPPTPQERWDDICREIREQRYVLFRDPNEDDWD